MIELALCSRFPCTFTFSYTYTTSVARDGRSTGVVLSSRAGVYTSMVCPMTLLVLVLVLLLVLLLLLLLLRLLLLLLHRPLLLLCGEFGTDCATVATGFAN